jgi:hypothetical protein
MNIIDNPDQNDAQGRCRQQGTLSSDNDNETTVNPDIASESNAASNKIQTGATQELNSKMSDKNKIAKITSELKGIVKDTSAQLEQSATILDMEEFLRYRGIIEHYFGVIETLSCDVLEIDEPCVGYHRRLGRFIGVVTSWAAVHQMCHRDFNPIVILDDPKLLNEIRQCAADEAIFINDCCPIIVEREDLYILENGVPLPLIVSDGEPPEISIIDVPDRIHGSGETE